MTPDQIDRVFGRGRLKMVTGEHVEVFREAARAGERRRYTKRFLNTVEADFGHWTEREWRILARLFGHGIDCVPEVVQFDRGALGGTQLVQTYDAGATVDQWATILPVSRDGRVLRHVFEDCAHWWALAHHSLRALFAIHELSVVHLDIKGDNVCIPVGPVSFDPDQPGLRLHPRFAEIALIDFAFALVSRESLTTALPIGWQTDYDYQSPRLLNALEAGRRGDLQPTRELDWRCDMYSLAAMLKRYLPDDDAVIEWGHASGWTQSRAGAAKELILGLRDAHDREASHRRPHQDFMQATAAHLADADMAASLSSGWTLARDASITPVAAAPLTPLTRLAPSIRVFVSPRARELVAAPPTVIRRRAPPPPAAIPSKPRAARAAVVTVLVVAGLAAVATPLVVDRFPVVGDTLRAAFERAPAVEPARANDSLPPQSPPPESPPQSPAAPAVAESTPKPEAAPAESAAVAPPALAEQPRSPSSSRSMPARLPRVAAEAPRKATQATVRPPAPPVATAKFAAPRTAVSTPSAPAQPRVRFHVPPESAPVANAQTPPVHVASAGPVFEILPPAKPEPARVDPPPPEVVRAPAPAEPPAVRAPAPPPARTASPTIAQDVRSVFGYLLGFAKRGDRAMAPIEDRATSQPRPASRQEAPRVVAGPAETASPVVTSPPEALAREPAPRVMPPVETVTQPAVRTFGPMPADLAAQGRRTLSESVPHTAARAEPEVARVLWLAAAANQPAQDRSVLDAVRRTWPSNTGAAMPASVSPAVARQLSDDARQAFMVRRDVGQAFDLQMRAFGANPGDGEVAGNLAFLFLKLNPSQPEIARQVAMHAIGVSPAQLRASRVDDWNTLAIASALTGREVDATNAMYVALALTRNLERTCRAALAAVDSHGDRMVAPVQAMMLRIRQQGRDHESPLCAWPPRWQSARGG